MEVNLTEVLLGKGTILKNKEYYPTQNYVQPFIDKLSKITDDFKFIVKMPKQMTIGNSDLDKTYNQVWVRAKLPKSYSFDGIDQSIGMIYSLDTRKPNVKFYRAGIDEDTETLYAFNPSCLVVEEIEELSPFNFSPVKNLLEMTDDLESKVTALKSEVFNRDFDIIDKKFGSWIHNSIILDYNNGLTQKVKIATSDIISAYKSLFIKPGTDHFIEEDKTCSTFDMYSALADQVTNDKEKDIVNKIEKILLIKDIFAIQ